MNLYELSLIWYFCQLVQNRTTFLIRQMSVSLSLMLKTVSSYLKRLRVYHLSNIYFWKQHLEERDKGSHIYRFPSCLSSIFTSNFHRMEKHKHSSYLNYMDILLSEKKQYLVCPLKVRTYRLSFYCETGLTYWREETL